MQKKNALVDALEHLLLLLNKFNLHTLVLNLDNGPENSCRRTQFMKRLVQLSHKYSINISLAYYPPYHSKYNPIERVWGRLENHWSGELLDSIEKVLGLARSMAWKGVSPIVNLIKKSYPKGISLTKEAMKKIEDTIWRIEGIEKWTVDILCYEG